MENTMATHKLFMRPILVLTSETARLTVGRTLSIRRLRQLKQSGGIILWDYEGQWGLVSKHEIAELVRRYDELQKTKKQYPRVIPPTSIIQLEFRYTVATSSGVAKVLRLKDN